MQTDISSWFRSPAARLLSLAAMVLVATGIGGAQAGTWQGKESNAADGHVVVSNPAKGYEAPASLDLEELWRLGGETDNEDEFFGVIGDIKIDDDGNVYLLDSQLNEVKIFSKDGEFIRSIGREGEGPGEFRVGLEMMFTSKGDVAVIQMLPGKIVVLSKEGDPVGELPLPQPEDGGFQMLQGGKSNGKNIVLYLMRSSFDQGSGIWSRADQLIGIDEEGNELAKYTAKKNSIEMANAQINDAKWDTFERRWQLDGNGRVYTCESYDDYVFTVYSSDGKLEREVTREYQHLPRTDKEKDLMQRLMEGYTKQVPGAKVTIAENTKDIQNIYVRDDGSIWVLNSRGARGLDEGTAGVFDVYNDKGHFVKTVTLKGDGDPMADNYVFVKDRFYVVTEFLQASTTARGVTGVFDEDEEPEPMAVICYKLDRDILAAR